jgi:hypothetical protein
MLCSGINREVVETLLRSLRLAAHRLEVRLLTSWFEDKEAALGCVDG